MNITLRRQRRRKMLTIPIKKKWYDMILSGEKKEEYREIKPYWAVRFTNSGLLDDMQPVIFRNGYKKDAPHFVASCTLDTGTGRSGWGAEEGKIYYRLHIKKLFENNFAKSGIF